MKVIGAGFGRTGTKSLQQALEIIGYDKCYHMVTLFQNTPDIKYWETAAKGGEVNWGELFQGYKSVVDFPGSLYYKELMEIYPDAKVILTVRDSDSWYKSTMATIYSFSPSIFTKLKLLLTSPFVSKSAQLIRIVKMNNATLWQGLFKGKFEDKTYAINVFEKHIEDTKRHVSPDKLLIFEVKDGWKPLCDFLGKPIPDVPFPKVNTSETFHDMTKQFLSISK